LNKVIFDNNMYNYLLIEYPDAKDIFEKYLKMESHVILPAIIEHEFLSHPQYEYDNNLSDVINLYLEIIDEKIELDSNIARKAAKIRRYYRNVYNKGLKAPDSIIAATAIELDAILVSNNDKDFNYAIKDLGLKYENPIKNQELLRNYKEEYFKNK